MKRFKGLAILLVIMLVVSAFAIGCAKKEEPKKEEPKQEAEKVTIRFAHWRGEDKQAFEDLIKKFNEKYPNITVEQDISGSEQYQNKLQAELLANSGPDIFTVMPGARFEAIATADAYLDLKGEALLQRVSAHLLLPGQKDGKQLAVPYQLVFNDPVYNVKMFEEVGYTADNLPKDWEGFLALCEALKKAGYTPILFDSEIGPGQFINPMLMNNMPSGDTLSKVQTGEAKLTDEWFVKTLSQFKELKDKGYFQEDILGTKKAGAQALFAQEKGAMLAQGSYMMASNKAANPNLKQGLIALITVPADQMKYEGIHTATFMFGINKNSKNIDAAKKFMDFVFSPENAAAYANATGQMLTVKGVEYNSEELKAQAPWVEKKTLFQPRYTITVPEVEKAIVTAVTDVIGGMSAEDAAKKAQAEVDRVIKK